MKISGALSLWSIIANEFLSPEIRVWVSESQCYRPDCSAVLHPVLQNFAAQEHAVCYGLHGTHSLPEGLWALSLLGIKKWPHGLLLGISAQTRIHRKEITTSKAIYFPSSNPYRNNPDLLSHVCILLSRDSVKYYSWQRSRRKHNGADRHWIFGVCQAGW